MKTYINAYQEGDKYVPDGKYFNLREASCGGASSGEYARWILKTDRGMTDKEANTYLDMLILAAN